MPLERKSLITPKKRSLHSASGFGKPARAPFPEPDKQKQDDAMAALLKSLQQIHEDDEAS